MPSINQVENSDNEDNYIIIICVSILFAILFCYYVLWIYCDMKSICKRGVCMIYCFSYLMMCNCIVVDCWDRILCRKSPISRC